MKTSPSSPASISTIDPSENSPLKIHDGFIQWPEGKTVNVGFGNKPVDYVVFEKKSTIFVPITISQNAVYGNAEFTIKAVFQACDDKTSSKFERQESAECVEVFYQGEREAEVDLRGQRERI